MVIFNTLILNNFLTRYINLAYAPQVLSIATIVFFVILITYWFDDEWLRDDYDTLFLKPKTEAQQYSDVICKQY